MNVQQCAVENLQKSLEIVRDKVITPETNKDLMDVLFVVELRCYIHFDRWGASEISDQVQELVQAANTLPIVLEPERQKARGIRREKIENLLVAIDTLNTAWTGRKEVNDNGKEQRAYGVVHGSHAGQI